MQCNYNTEIDRIGESERASKWKNHLNKIYDDRFLFMKRHLVNQHVSNNNEKEKYSI